MPTSLGATEQGCRTKRLRSTKFILNHCVACLRGFPYATIPLYGLCLGFVFEDTHCSSKCSDFGTYYLGKQIQMLLGAGCQLLAQLVLFKIAPGKGKEL